MVACTRYPEMNNYPCAFHGLFNALIPGFFWVLDGQAIFKYKKYCLAGGIKFSVSDYTCSFTPDNTSCKILYLLRHLN
jgi:hypothetical protein